MRRISARVVPALVIVTLFSILSSATTPGAPMWSHLPGRVTSTPVTTTQAITLDVPILMYHHIGAPFKSPYNVSTSDFEAHMDYLAHNGYASVSIDQIAAALRGEIRLPPCPVAIALDDGYVDQYENALPILREHGFRATFDLPAGYVGMSRSFMGLEQVRALADQGMWIGAHTYNHAELTTLSAEALRHQVVDSKVKLESELGISVTTFAYPYGSYNAAVTQATRDAGYAAAFGIGFGYHQSPDRAFRLNRIAMYDLSLPEFIARLPKHGPYGKGLCPRTAPPERDGWRFWKTFTEN